MCSFLPLICILLPDGGNQSSIDLRVCEDEIIPDIEPPLTPKRIHLMLFSHVFKGCVVSHTDADVRFINNILCLSSRRDSAVIKDEIKSFLASRRISQAVVAQVTGEFSVH